MVDGMSAMHQGSTRTERPALTLLRSAVISAQPSSPQNHLTRLLTRGHRACSRYSANAEDVCPPAKTSGGTIMLGNDQNALNPTVRKDTEEMWVKRETSWEWAAQLKAWRPIEHADAKPFSVMRADIVRAANPALDANAVTDLVAKTAGLLKDVIEEAARTYGSNRELPFVDEYSTCRNPITGEYAERLFNPYVLADILTAMGLQTQVRHLFRKFPLNLVNGVQFRPFNNLLFQVRPFFLIFGRRPV